VPLTFAQATVPLTAFVILIPCGVAIDPQVAGTQGKFVLIALFVV